MRTQTSSEGTKAEDAPHAAVFQDPQRPESGLVQRDVAHFAVLCSGNGQNLVPKVDMLPEHFVLFAAPQSGIDGDVELRDMNGRNEFSQLYFLSV